jgi:hypothetical protein
MKSETGGKFMKFFNNGWGRAAVALAVFGMLLAGLSFTAQSADAANWLDQATSDISSDFGTAASSVFATKMKDFIKYVMYLGIILMVGGFIMAGVMIIFQAQQGVQYAVYAGLGGAVVWGSGLLANFIAKSMS